MGKSKIALFGGSFNPPHISHQMICFYLLEYKQFDLVYLIPTYDHPFGKDLISFEDRWKMCVFLCESFNGKVRVSSVESCLANECGGKNYTIDTIRHFVSNYPNDKFTLVIGSDILKDLDKWKEFNKIENLADVIVFMREDKDQVKANSTGILSPIWLRSIENLRIPKISSTEVRARIAAGKSIENFVPPKIREYIQKNSLYI